MSTIANKIQSIRQTLPPHVQLVLVTKTVGADRIEEAAQAGALEFAENRVQELLAKKSALKGALPSGVKWHMIGRLQTNKVKQVLQEVVLIHSLDRPELAEEIERQAEKLGIKAMPCLIQVNASGESTKAGFKPEDVADFVRSFAWKRIELRGLMTVGPLYGDARQSFRRVRELQQDLKKQFPAHIWDTLSMGMSGDYKIAIEEGSTLVRIGTAVFGERK